MRLTHARQLMPSKASLITFLEILHDLALSKSLMALLQNIALCERSPLPMSAQIEAAPQPGFYKSPIKPLSNTPTNTPTGYASVLITYILITASPAQGAALSAGNLADLSFEQLADIQIISVSKKAERLADAPASVFVITAEDIRRSGARSLPAVLRLAPNLEVAQSNASDYAISARGFNGSNNSAPNKLLVLIDGRSIYTPLFSGVFWDAQDVMLEDVERIEVISGPGGTLWGINAVNGVINVITRPAKDTQGQIAVAAASLRGADAVFRSGGTIGADGNYRVYGKYAGRSHTVKEDGSAVNDALHKTQIGFQADWDRTADQYTIQGNAYDGAEGQPAPGAISISGQDIALGAISFSGINLTSRWTHQLDGGSNVGFQAYFDRTMRTVPPTFGESLDIVDIQVQHTLRPFGMQSIIWGANYRYSRDRVTNSPYIAFLPANVDQKWASLFIQDEIALREDLHLTVGARIERNDYTDNEFLPSARLAWKLNAKTMLWTAASRAVRAPSRLDSDVFVPGSAPFLLRGGPNVRSEVADVYEIGYRGQPITNLSYSVTVFHDGYNHLRTQEIDPTRTFVTFGNEMEGTANGVEMWGTYQALPNWRLNAGFTALREKLRLKPASNDIPAPDAAGNDPSHTWQLRSTWDFAANLDFDITLRHVAKLTKNEVPAYTTADMRLAWKVRPDLDLSVVGQNLLGHHAEYGSIENRTQNRPGISLKLIWRN